MTEPKDLLYTLVKVGEEVGVLSGIRQDGSLLLRGEGGRERAVTGTPVRVELVCRTCDTPVAQKLYDGLCSDCERRRAATLPKPRETCEECGALGAYYSPAAKRFRCANCHARHRSNTGLFAEARTREAIAGDVCKGQHIDDPRHQWVQVRGRRFHCRMCKSKTFEAPASFADRSDVDVEVEE